MNNYEDFDCEMQAQQHWEDLQAEIAEGSYELYYSVFNEQLLKGVLVETAKANAVAAVKDKYSIENYTPPVVPEYRGEMFF